MPDDWLPIPAAALAYNVSQRTIRRRILAGKLAHRKEPGVGGAVLVEAPRAVEGQVVKGVDKVDSEGQSVSMTVPEQVAVVDMLGQFMSTVSSQAEDIGELKARIARLEAELERTKQRRPWWRRWTGG
jgi:hypothetical protein